MILPMLNDYEIDWPSRHFEPWLANHRWPCASEPILKAAPAHLRQVIESAAMMLARDVAAARASWSPFRGRLVDLGENLGLERAEVNELLDRAYREGVSKPATWAKLARSWLHIASSDSYFFLRSATELPAEVFDRTHRWDNPEPFCETSEFLLQHGFVASVAELTFNPDEPIGFFKQSVGLRFNASPHASIRPPAPVEVA